MLYYQIHGQLLPLFFQTLLVPPLYEFCTTSMAETYNGGASLPKSFYPPFQVFMLVQGLENIQMRDLFGHGKRTSVYNLFKVFVDIWMTLVKYK